LMVSARRNRSQRKATGFAPSPARMLQ
jgi:hypothetical protein